MASSVVFLADEGCSATEESVDTGGNNDTLSLTLFACRSTANAESVNKLGGSGEAGLTKSIDLSPFSLQGGTRQ